MEKDVCKLNFNRRQLDSWMVISGCGDSLSDSLKLIFSKNVIDLTVSLVTSLFAEVVLKLTQKLDRFQLNCTTRSSVLHSKGYWNFGFNVF